MKSKSIEMISYNKISYLSDAFIVLDDLDSYIDLVTNSNYSSGKLPLDKYTAGTTNNPDDYKLPDNEYLVKKRSLSEISAFNSTLKQNILLRSDHHYKDEYQILKDSEEDIPENLSNLYSPDAQDIMRVLEQNFFHLSNSKKYDHSKFELSKNIKEYVIFELNERYFNSQDSETKSESGQLNLISPNIQKQDKRIENIFENTDITNIHDENVTEYEIQNINQNTDFNISNQNTNVYNGKNIKYKTNVENRYKSVKYSIQNITKNYITEIKQEIIQEVEQMVNILETKIKNENITRLEINNIKNEIVNNIERKIDSHTKNAIDQYESKSKAEIKDMFKKFLNS